MTYVSIIIPTFNKSPLVCDIVRKLKEQTFKDFEIIVVDDGSSDDTIKELRLLRRVERHLKVKIYTTGLHDKFGMCQAINLGLKNARGVLTFLCNDDIYLHNRCIEQHVKKQIETGNKHCLIGPRFWSPPNNIGEIVTDENVKRQMFKKYLTKERVASMPIYRQKMMVSSNVSILTNNICAVGGYNEYFIRYTGAIDREFYYRLQQSKIKVLYLWDAQAYSVRYDNLLYRQTKWIQDSALRENKSIEQWKREQTRYAERQYEKALKHRPSAIKRLIG